MLHAHSGCYGHVKATDKATGIEVWLCIRRGQTREGRTRDARRLLKAKLWSLDRSIAEAQERGEIGVSS